MPENLRNTKRRKREAVHYAPLSSFLVEKGQAAFACGEPLEEGRPHLSIHSGLKGLKWAAAPGGGPTCEGCLASPLYTAEAEILAAEKAARESGAPPLYACGSGSCAFTASEFWEWHLHHHATQKGHWLAAAKSSFPPALAQLPELAAGPVQGAPAAADGLPAEGAAAQPPPLSGAYSGLSELWLIDEGPQGLRLKFAPVPSGHHLSALVTMLPELRPCLIRCDGCGSGVPVKPRMLAHVGSKHRDCAKEGTWRTCFRLAFTRLGQALLVDGLHGQEVNRLPDLGDRPYEDRKERLEDAAREAGNLLASLGDLAQWSEDAGEADLASFFRRLSRVGEPLASTLEAIQQHAERGGGGLPPELAEWVGEKLTEERALLERLAQRFGSNPWSLARPADAVKDSSGPSGAAWIAQEDAARLAASLQTAAQRAAGHRLAAQHLIPERLALMGAQVRQGAQALAMVRQLVLLPEGAEVPEELRALLEPFISARMTVLPGDRPRCGKCGFLMSPGPLSGAELGPLVCSSCDKPEKDCSCAVIDEVRDQVLAGDVDSAAVVVCTLADVVRRASGRALELPEGNPVRLMVEGLCRRVERLAFHLARLAGALPGEQEPAWSEDAPPTLASALVELELAGEEFARAADVAALVAAPSYEEVRYVLSELAKRARAEATGSVILRRLVPSKEGEPLPAGAAEWLGELVTGTRTGNAPACFVQGDGKGEEGLARLFQRGLRLANQLVAVARSGAGLAEGAERARAWKFPEVLGDVAKRCEGLALVFRSLARFDKLKHLPEAPAALAEVAQSGLVPELLGEAPRPPGQVEGEAGDAQQLRQVLSALGWHLDGREPGALGVWWAHRLVEGSPIWVNHHEPAGLVGRVEQIAARLVAGGSVTP